MSALVPDGLIKAQTEHGGPEGRAWLVELPRIVEEYLDRWRLRVDGDPGHGMGSLVLPVLREDGTRAALKLGPVTEDNEGESAVLRAWDGDGAVRLLELDQERRVLLLERLDAARPLSTVADPWEALDILTGLLARVIAVPPPEGLRRLSDIAAAMLADVERALPRLADPGERALLDTCAGAVRDLVGEPGHHLLHWDLHQGNVLASLPDSGREPWLVIDPQPLVGDPGFDLMPSLDDRWEEVVASGDVPGVVRRRFDLMTDALGLDRRRAAGWTLGRVLQNSLWDIGGGETSLNPEQVAIGRALLGVYA
ncbi:aminoglycoside phosphotransferase family protein [Allokutzneria oryzae]|uniref:Aminoglycoside phosphotransferase family protein n=1 Tax=Allokutzneria oryzae TaxID=1378989 RepID=A0ABV6A8J2_9PSEU